MNIGFLQPAKMGRCPAEPRTPMWSPDSLEIFPSGSVPVPFQRKMLKGTKKEVLHLISRRRRIISRHFRADGGPWRA
jgi:hypothetical protein